MVGITHIADIHAGLSNLGKIDSETKMNTRTVEIFNSFDTIIKWSIEYSDLMCISGDVFETVNPSNRIRKEFEKRMDFCSKNGLPVVIIPGNHCTPRTDGGEHPFISATVFNLPGIFVIDKVGVQKITAKNGESIDVLGIPYISRGKLLEYGENEAEATKSIIDGCKTRNGKACVGMAHLTIEGIVNHYSPPDLIARDVIVPRDIFEEQDKCGAFLLGHIHQHIFISDKLWYSGSIAQNEWGEEKDKKGWIFFKIDSKNKIHDRKFIELENYTKLKTVYVRLNKEDDNPTEIILNAIKSMDVEKFIIRLRYDLYEHQLFKIDSNKIGKLLEKALGHTIDYDVVEVEVKTRNEKLTHELSIKDATREFCESKGGDYKKRVDELIALTEKLVEEVMIDKENKIKAGIE